MSSAEDREGLPARAPRLVTAAVGAEAVGAEAAGKRVRSHDPRLAMRVFPPLVVVLGVGLAGLVVSEGLPLHAPVLVVVGAMMLVMIGGAVLLDRESSRRIRSAECSSRDLEYQVAQRTAELRATSERLDAIQTQQSQLERVTIVGEMAAIVAHEVRTPLNALSINVQMIGRLLRGEGEGPRARARELLGTLHREIERMNRLLEDHLLAHVRRRRMRLEPIDLNEHVRDAIRFTEAEATRQKVRLNARYGELEPARADPAQLRQIVLNLLRNAIQAMPEGGEVRLSTRQRDGALALAIEDTGPGIDLGGVTEPEELRHVVRPFVTSKQDGTGLGLAICARLAQEMGARITVRSGLGGTCFEIVLLPCREDER